MGFVYDYNSMALVLRQAKPITFNGSWESIKDALVKAGEIVINSGIVQKVMSITKSASTTETAGETLSALCAMDVSESTVAGATVTTLTPKAAITFTPKTVALSAIAGAIGLDFGFRIGQNLVNTYFGDEWDWHAPGIYDAAKDAIRTYINADGTTYYDEDTIKAFSNRLNEVGAFADVYINKEVYNPELPKISSYSTVPLSALISKTGALANYFIEVCNHFNLDINDNNSLYLLYGGPDTAYGIGCLIFKIDKTNNVDEDWFINNVYYYYDSLSGRSPFFNYPSCYTYQGNFYDNGQNIFSEYDSEPSTLLVVDDSDLNVPDSLPKVRFIGITLGTLSQDGGIDGVTKQDGATVPSNFPLDIPQTYPTWQPNAIVRPDVESAITYPVAMPDTDVLDGTVTRPQDKAQTGENTDAENSKVIEDAITIVPEIAKDIEATADPTIDGGETPIPVIPAIGAQATGFVALYNPTQSQLSAFSQYLWSNEFIENFKKLFSNPMDAIIGLHLIYATPSRGNVAEIVCGYSHSGVMSNTVNSQYIEINCGSIKVNRYFGNVLDYAPYTKLQVYLPFVGIVDLDTNEIMNGTLNIKYRIDVLTGSCLARLKVTRGDYKAEIYNFAGNCAVQLPISGGSYSGIIANAIGVAGSIGATIASGGALAPVLVGSMASSAVNSHTNVSHSGSLGSNAGALGIMKPYLIITRPKPAEANNYNEFYGKPSNKTVRLRSCNGYTRVKEVHVDNIVATDNELSEIEQLLKEGVII